jgi:NAD(P)-dependent dehydrogenase (short-subunit alcohol dehydrogenase family)
VLTSYPQEADYLGTTLPDVGNPLALIVGAGPGLGAALARRYAGAGHDVALVARSESKLAGIGEQVRSAGVEAGWTAADVSDAGALRAAVARLGEHAGRIDVLHFNVVAFRAARVKELTAADLLDDLAVGAASLLTAVDAARPLMSAGSVVLATGSVTADRPMPSAVSLGVQKAALRNLVAALDRDLRRDGIRAASVTVRGTIAAGTPFDPDRIAEVFVQLSANAANAGDEWRTEVPYTG